MTQKDDALQYIERALDVLYAMKQTKEIKKAIDLVEDAGGWIQS